MRKNPMCCIHTRQSSASLSHDPDRDTVHLLAMGSTQQQVILQGGEVLSLKHQKQCNSTRLEVGTEDVLCRL